MKRFWEKMRADGTGCFVWISAINEWGYGRFELNGKNMHAHRIAWTLIRGPIPNGLQVLHSCDSPPCCNVDHLFLGTNADNTADKVSKGRQSSMKGEAHPKAKLTVEQVKIIRSSTKTTAELAKEFGIKWPSVYYIRIRRTWKHVP